MRSAAHLAQFRFKPGQCGNPRGGPRKADESFAHLLELIGHEKLPGRIAEKLKAHLQHPHTMSFKQALARAIYFRAIIDGEAWAVQFIAERTEGKVRDTLEIEGGQTLTITERIVRTREEARMAISEQA